VYDVHMVEFDSSALKESGLASASTLRLSRNPGQRALGMPWLSRNRRRRVCCQVAVYPPSTLRMAPVM
jgi:hypothetical protein